MKQKQALEILKMGSNVYLTGSAGSGKTYLLQQYINYLKENGINVGITASTGIAATHLAGITIHSWSGMGIKNQISDKDIKNIKTKGYLKQRYAKTKVLIIDEISMLEANWFQELDRLCKAMKNSNLPFGGMQIVLSGDLFQLPPVRKYGTKIDQIYTSSTWRDLNLSICYLEEQYRQFDKKFMKLLNRIRDNKEVEEIVKVLRTRYNKPIKGIETPTKLYTHNLDVDAINNKELEKLNGKDYTYEMLGDGNPVLVDILRKSCLAPEKLVLKENAIVMFVKNNFEKGYVNGTLGKVVRFDKEKNPVVEIMSGDRITVKTASWLVEEDDVIEAQITQLPLRLAWAITIHKSQGMSLDAAEIDLAKSFEPGMGYVALSRVRSLKGIKLLGLNETALQVNPQIVEYDKSLQKLSKLIIDELKALNNFDKKSRQKNFLRSVHGDDKFKNKTMF